MIESDPPELEQLAETLLAVAQGTFTARAPRSLDGGPLDVLAFLVNATAEEVEILVADLERRTEDLHRAQEQLVHAEKLAALGRLAAGVAHEMNQPLTVILALVDLMSEDPALDAGRQDLETVRTAAIQLARIVDDVRSFGRAAPLQTSRIPASAPLSDAVRLLRGRIRDRGITLHEQVSDQPLLVLADRSRLQQVFVNLLCNACDALAQDSTGDPAITVRLVHRGRSAVYEIEDNGPGVATAHLPLLFEPFFTTRGVGGGTGLGLSVSLGIVQDHGGELVHRPAGDGGARFVVSLPAVESDLP